MTPSVTGKTLLVIGAGPDQVPGIRIAKEMGLFVIATDGNPEAPGLLEADQHLIVSTKDTVGTVEAALAFHKTQRAIDGVIAYGVDIPLTIAQVAETLKLPHGISPRLAEASMNKLEMKERFQASGICVPDFYPISSLRDLEQCITSHQGNKWVLKPIDNSAARGVLQVDPQTDRAWAFETCKKYTTAPVLLLESFLEGPQISTETLIVNGMDYTIGIADRNYEHLARYAPYIVENGGSLPCVLPPSAQTEIRLLIRQIVRALNIKNGVIKGDIVYTTEGPKVIEIALRLSGGCFSLAIEYSTGVPVLKLATLLALGVSMTPEAFTIQQNQGAALRYLFPPAGQIESLVIPSALCTNPGVKRLITFYHEGDTLPETTNHASRLGYTITQAATAKEAIALAEETLAQITVKTADWTQPSALSQHSK